MASGSSAPYGDIIHVLGRPRCGLCWDRQKLLNPNIVKLVPFLCYLLVPNKWQCRYQVQPKQRRTVGVAELIITSIFERDIFELTSCPECKG